MKNKEWDSVYEPDLRLKMGFFQVWLTMAKNIASSWELISILFKRDFVHAYKKSFLGMSWLVLAPVIGVVQWVFMNLTGVLNPGDVGMPYPAYVLLSTSIWGLFMGIYSAAAETLSAGQGFILQVRYPHEALFAKQAAQSIAQFSINFFLNIFILLVFGVIPSWKIILFPVAVLPLLGLGAGIGLFISVFSVVTLEARRLADLVLGLLIWVTPIIYSARFKNPVIQKIIYYNPLTYLVGTCRDLIVSGEIKEPLGFVISSGIALIVFLLSWRLFFVSEEKVVEKML